MTHIYETLQVVHSPYLN